MKILEIIAGKLEKAFLLCSSSKFHTVIELVFKPNLKLTEEEEADLRKWIKSDVVPERVYICCNRAWQDGENFKAFLHLHDFDPEGEAYKLLLEKLRVC